MQPKKGSDQMNYSPAFSLENFKVIPPPTYEVSFSEIKISPKALLFNATTVSELSYSEDIALFFNPEDKIQAITPSAKSDYSCPFFSRENNRRNVTIVHEQLTAAVRSTMNWPARKGTYRIPGIRIPNSSQIFLCFDLKLGSCAKKETRKIDPKTFLSACPSIREVDCPNSKFRQFALPPASAVHTNARSAEAGRFIVDAERDEYIRSY